MEVDERGYRRESGQVACEESSQRFYNNWGRFFRCSDLILFGPGAVRFLTDEIACRIFKGRTFGTT
ncbi:hypothetical protein DICVIV_09596 [Dictyocaulus viviparus]|uniref:Uncharacterized protein n=1 Tax=Dictyocaulus viviparus TaxID=29172 RepID=A0A0D8XIA9_DICVI|nr:hypothetical protein DICVIV_09596 [Dictyocaulus viviparus]